MESSVSTTEYTAFDILGRVTSHKQTTDGNEYTTGYTYSLSGAMLEQTYPSGRVVKNTLDADGGLALVQSKKTSSDFYRPYASNLVYNAAGAVTAMRLGNGRWENTVFNSRMQPTQIGLGNGVNSQNLLKLEYEYGATASVNNGNVTKQTITVPGVANPFVQTYAYDELNRLTNAEEIKNSVQQWEQTFTYDRFGNRNFNEAETTFAGFDKLCSGNTVLCSDLKKRLNPSINTANNRLSTSDDYAFDSSGNTTADAEGRTFIYDAENKQVEVKDSLNATIGEYSYDGDGRRVKKVVSGGETTIFVYDAASKLIGEYSTVVQTGSNAKTVYTTNDHLGSPRINTDGTGQVISRHDYHPFGEEIARTGYGSDTIRKQFTGYERDGETGLDFAQARYFVAEHGRFSSPDPLAASANSVRPQSWNRYSYVYNNPYRYNDPTGMVSRVAVDSDQNESASGDKKSPSNPPPTCPGGCRPSLDVAPPPVSNADAFYSSSTVYESLGMTEPIPESVPAIDRSPRMIAKYNVDLTMTLVNRETGTSRTDFSYEISYSGASPQNSQTGNRQRAPDNGVVDLGTFTVYTNQNQETLAAGMPPLPDGTNRTFSGTVTIFGSNGERVATTSFEATVTKTPGSYPQAEIGETRREVFTTPRQVWERQPNSNP